MKNNKIFECVCINEDIEYEWAFECLCVWVKILNKKCYCICAYVFVCLFAKYKVQGHSLPAAVFYTFSYHRYFMLLVCMFRNEKKNNTGLCVFVYTYICIREI